MTAPRGRRSYSKQMRANFDTPQKQLSMLQVLACGAAIMTLSMSIRHGFGLWL